MTVDQILTLINAGYTKDEIQAMSTAPAAQPAAPADGPAEKQIAQETAAQPKQTKLPDEQPKAAADPKPQEPQQTQPAAQAQPEGDAQRILKALGDLAKGVDVPPAHELTIEEKLGNTILAAMGMKLPKEDN